MAKAYDAPIESICSARGKKMNVLESLMHFAQYTLAVYAAYVVLGSMAFGLFIWRRVYAPRKPVERRMQPRLHDSDPSAH
jgi:hypothetical protein